MSLEKNETGDDAQVLKSWMIECKHIQSGGLVGTKTATAEECAQIAELLGVEEVVSISCEYDFGAFAKRRYPLDCTFFAEIKQLSVYSLEVVEQKITSRFHTELFQLKDGDEVDQFYLPNAEDGIEDMDRDFFDGEVIELGRIVYEFLSLEVDGFAHKEGELLSWRDQNKKETDEQNKKASPFAALEALKKK